MAEPTSPSRPLGQAARPRLEIRVLGGFALVHDGQLVDVSSWQRRPATLLRLLATSGGRVTRDEVIEYFWPESGPDKGATNLRQVLYQLRRELGANPPPVIVEGGWVSLNPALGWTSDVVLFTNALEAAGDDLAALEAALGLYTGEALPEDRYEDWAVPARERTFQTYRQAALRVAEIHWASGSAELALDRVVTLLGFDPFNETAIRLQLKVLAQVGRRAEAVKVYNRFKERLVAELELEPEPETAAVAQELASAAPPPHDWLATAPSIGFDEEHTLPRGGFLGAIPSGPLVGRDTEMQRLRAVINDVLAGSGRLVTVAGEPGIGKTRLAQEVTLHLRPIGVLVVTGQCYLPEQTIPYYPFLDALGAASGAAPQVIQAEIPRRWPHLARLLPNRAQRGPGNEMVEHDGQQALFWAVTDFLHVLAALAPIALLIDDLHWADESTLILLQHLARHLRGDPVLLLGTYRDAGAMLHPALARVLRDLHRDGLLTELAVSHLDLEGTAELSAETIGEAHVSDQFAAFLYTHAGGNPFFTQELVKALVERGDVLLTEGVWERRATHQMEVPRTIRSAIGERVSRLSGSAREVLREASVLGQIFSFDHLIRMGSHAEVEIEAALEEALAAGLLKLSGDEQYIFNHALTHQVLYSELLPPRRKRLHAAAGDAMVQTRAPAHPGRDGQTAWHFLQAGRTERALPFVLLAGDEAEAVFAHSEAERHYRLAVELAREQSDHTREAEGMTKLGVVLFLEGAYDAAIDALGDAADIYLRSENLEPAARATAWIGLAHRWRGTPDEGIDIVQRMWTLVSASVPTAGHASLHISLASLYFLTGRYQDMLRAAERAGEIAREIGDETLLGEAEERMATALGLLARLDEAIAVYRHALPMIQAGENPLALYRVLKNMGTTCEQLGRLQEAREHMERALQLTGRMASPDLATVMLGNLGRLLITIGDWQGAYAHLARAVVPKGQVRGVSAVYPLTHLGQLALYQGRWAEAEEALREAVATAQITGERQYLERTQVLLAELEMLRSHPQDAVIRLEALTARDDVDFGVFPLLARAHFEAGALERAEQTVLDAVHRARDGLERLHLVDGLLVQGMVFLGQRRLDEARAVMQEGLEIAGSLPYPYAAAHLHRQLGLLEQQHGQPGQARQHLEQALATFQRLGAGKDLEQTEQALAALDGLGDLTR